MSASVFRQFIPLHSFITGVPWRLTGFAGTSGRRDPRPGPAMSITWSYSTRQGAVILLQETRMARVTARHLIVGAFWYGDD